MVWAVLQFALPAAATFGDARLEREGAASPGAHVESQSAAGCRAVHQAECGLCQVVSRATTPAPHPPSWRDIAVVVRCPEAAGPAQRLLAGQMRLSSARAPPI